MSTVHRESAHTLPPNVLAALREQGATLTGDGRIQTQAGTFALALDASGLWCLGAPGAVQGYTLTAASFEALRLASKATPVLVAVQMGDGTRIAAIDPSGGPPDPT